MDSRQLLKGFVDIHIHAAPSLIPRSIDAIEMAREADKAGYRAIVIKDHDFLTAPLATLIEKYVPLRKDLRVFGGLVLNNSCGGLNPKATEVAIAAGAKMIWMPTIASLNHMNKHQNVKFPGMGFEFTVPEIPLSLIDENGELIQEAIAILQVIAKHHHVVLATGHVNRHEVSAIVSLAHELGIKRILVNHPTIMVDATIEDMLRWTSMGAMVEHTATVTVPSSINYCMPVQNVVEVIRQVGTQHTILSSDYGQLKNGNPVEGMVKFIDLLLEHGVTEQEIIQMTRDNPSKLLGLD